MSDRGERTEAEREAERRARAEARARRTQGSTPPPQAQPPRPPAEPPRPPAQRPQPARPEPPRAQPQPPAARVDPPAVPLTDPPALEDEDWDLEEFVTDGPPMPTAGARPQQPRRTARQQRKAKPRTPRPPRPSRAERVARVARQPGERRTSSSGRGRYGRRRVLGGIVAGGFLVIVVVVAWFLISLFQPFTGSGSGVVTVTIPPEDSTAQIGTILVNNKVVSSSFFFRVRAELDGDHIRSGSYTLKHGMSYGAALAVLKKGPTAPPTVNVTIIPGKSRYQIGQLLAKEGVRGSYRVNSRTSPSLDPATYGAPKGTGSLEGFLYPDTYNLRRPITIPALVADQLKAFKSHFATVNFSYAKSKNLTPYDVLIVASLEDAEAALPSDLPKVASVIYNRLHDNMTLGLDTTAAFAANNYTGNLTQSQLNSSSPWNTLIHKGLPPTPIDNPDVTAINAAAHPAHTNYLYFIVKVCGNGSLAFTNNYAQFQRLSVQYNAAVAKRGVNKTEFCSTKK